MGLLDFLFGKKIKNMPLHENERPKKRTQGSLDASVSGIGNQMLSEMEGGGSSLLGMSGQLGNSALLDEGLNASSDVSGTGSDDSTEEELFQKLRALEGTESPGLDFTEFQRGQSLPLASIPKVKEPEEAVNFSLKDLKGSFRRLAKKAGNGLANAGNAAVRGIKKLGPGIKKYFVNGHREAVDAYNNHMDDYEKLSRFGKLKWAVLNPLAWLRGGRSASMADTFERNVEKKKLSRLAKKLSPVFGRTEDTSDSLESLLGKPSAQSAAEGILSESRFDENGLNGDDELSSLPEGSKESGSAGQKSIEALSEEYSKAREIAKMVTGLSMVPFGASLLPTLTGATGSELSKYNTMGAAAALMDMTNGAILSHEARERGDTTEAVSQGLTSAKNGTFVASGVTSAIANVIGGSAGTAMLGKAVPGIGMATGAFDIASGTARYRGAKKQKENIGKIIRELKSDKSSAGKKNAGRYLKTLNQVNAFADVDKTKGIGDITSGALRTLGNAMVLTGIGAPVGAFVGSVAAPIAGIGGKLLAGSKQTDAIKQSVDEEMGLEKKISALRRWMPALSREKAKYVVFKSMGITSGTRQEAFQRMTMKRAMRLRKEANEGGLAEKIVQGMNLKKTKKGYSLQAIAGKLGMDKSIPWEAQLAATLAKKNPFV